jgi:hypothetical protein
MIVILESVTDALDHRCTKLRIQGGGIDAHRGVRGVRGRVLIGPPRKILKQLLVKMH